MGVWTGTIPTSFPAGAKLRGADMQTISDALTALSSAKTDFSSSFTLTAVTVNPTKGSSTYSAAYTQVNKLVIYEFRVDINTGGGWAAGTGAYRFLTPVAASTGSISRAQGSVFINDSGTALVVGTCSFVPLDSTHLAITLASGASLGSAGPGTAWATGDHVEGSIVYEAA